MCTYWSVSIQIYNIIWTQIRGARPGFEEKQLQVQTARAADADALPLDPKPSAQASDTGAQGGPSGVKSYRAQ